MAIHIAPIIGLTSLYGTSTIAVPVPCPDGLLSQWEIDFDTDDKVTDIKAGVGTHVAIPAQYLYMGTAGYSITFAGMGAGVTITSHSGTATCSLTTGTLTCSVAGTLHQLVLSDGTKYSCGETVGTLIAPDIAGINGVLSGFTLPSDRQSSAAEGKTWNLASFIIANGGGLFDSGVYLPASYTSEGTLYTGTAQQNLDVDGFAGDWDGATFGTLAAPLVSSGDFKYSGTLSIANTDDARIIMGGNNITEGLFGFDTDSHPFIYINSSTTTFSSLTLPIGIESSWELKRIGSNITITINSVLETKALSSGTFTVRYIGGWGGGVIQRWEGTLPVISYYNPINTLVRNYTIQSSNTTTQVQFYDTITGEVATLTGATTPFFTAAGGRWIGQWGGTVSGINIIPGRESSTLDALGNVKGFVDYKDSNLPADTVNITLPETLEMYEAAPGLFTLGVPDATDSSTISDGDEDEIRKSDVAILVTDGAQTGACKTETDTYLGL